MDLFTCRAPLRTEKIVTADTNMINSPRSLFHSLNSQSLCSLDVHLNVIYMGNTPLCNKVIQRYPLHFTRRGREDAVFVW